VTRGITAAELRAVQIRRPGWGQRGYDPGAVDALLARAADALEALAAGGVPRMTADEVRGAVFRRPPFGRGRGYDEHAVDALLDAVEESLRGGPLNRPIELNGRPLEP